MHAIARQVLAANDGTHVNARDMTTRALAALSTVEPCRNPAQLARVRRLRIPSLAPLDANTGLCTTALLEAAIRQDRAREQDMHLRVGGAQLAYTADTFSDRPDSLMRP